MLRQHCSGSMKVSTLWKQCNSYSSVGLLTKVFELRNIKFPHSLYYKSSLSKLMCISLYSYYFSITTLTNNHLSFLSCWGFSLWHLFFSFSGNKFESFFCLLSFAYLFFFPSQSNVVQLLSLSLASPTNLFGSSLERRLFLQLPI